MDLALAQELTERGYAAGYMELTTSGAAVGQINALTVLDTGTIEFGRPCRITCNSGVAIAERSGLVNIEGLGLEDLPPLPMGGQFLQVEVDSVVRL